MVWSTSLVVWSVSLVTYASTQSIYISDNVSAEKGKDVQITCQLELKMPWTSNVLIYRSDTQDDAFGVRVGICYNHDCIRRAPRVVVISDGRNVYVNITNLDRKEDEKYWTCKTTNISVQLFLVVYTPPADALLTSSLTYPHSLSVGPMSMDCSTNSCTYKDPVFKWYIKMGDGSQQLFNHGSIVSTVDSSSCNDSEKVYHSTLSLQQNMTFPGNIDVTVQFICGISFPTLVDDLLSTPTGNLTFAVQVTHVQLYDDSHEMIDGNQVIVTENVPYSITCLPGPSRPPPVYRFYIATNRISESKSNKSTFIPRRNQHGMMIYCKAYNLQKPQDAVVSEKPLLFVKGRPVQPRTFVFTGSRGTNATFYWIWGFNGGFRQRFILQYRKLDTNDWTNVTETMEVRTTNNLEIPLDEYRSHIRFAPGEYQARLIASNINGETVPVNILDSTFQIMLDDERESSSSHSSFTTPIIGAVLGTLNAVLLGINIFQCVWSKRKQTREVPETSFKLKETPKSQVTPGDAYEELGPTTEAARSTYDTLESKTMSPTNPFSQEYENTTVG